MANLEAGFIQQNEGGWLEITEGYPWQIVRGPSEEFPDGSILWRLFRGWNERRLVCGKPMQAYNETQFEEVEDIEEAIISIGSNLQNKLFWQAFETEDFVPVLQTNPDTTNYVIALGTVEDNAGILIVHDSYAASQDEQFSVDDKFDVGIEPTEAGDILGMEKINAILRRMYAYKDAHLRVGRYTDTLEEIRYPITALRPFEGCLSGTYTSIFGEFFNDFTSYPYVYAYDFYFGVFECDFSFLALCKANAYSYAQLSFFWPSFLLCDSHKYVWATIRQNSLLFAYQKSADVDGSPSGFFDTRNAHPAATSQYDYWKENGAVTEGSLCGNGVFPYWSAETFTNNLLASPKFSDLVQL